MNLSRRDFLGSVSGAALAGSACGQSSVPGSSPDDPLGVRSDFPVVGEYTYLNSPYITPSPLPVVEAGHAFLDAKARNPISLGGMLEETDAVRIRFARLVGASVPEVGVLFATSDGENLVANSLDLGPGDNVVIDDLHYETTYVLYRHLEATRGVELRIARNRDGAAPVEVFAGLVDDRTRLVSVAWVSHQNGYRHDLTGLAGLAHEHGAYLYADAIQGIGMLDLDVKAVGIDFLTAGTYKWLLGGYGAAPFYVREELLELVAIDRMGSLHIREEHDGFRYTLHTDARKYGYATLGFGAVFQLRAALDYLLQVGVTNVERHTVALAHRLRDGLVAQGFAVDTPAANRSSIITFAHGRTAADVQASLEANRITASPKENGTKLRVGAALFNNAEDIARFLEVTATWA